HAELQGEVDACAELFRRPRPDPPQEAAEDARNRLETMPTLNGCGKAALTIAVLDFRPLNGAEPVNGGRFQADQLQHRHPRVQRGSGAAGAGAPARPAARPTWRAGASGFKRATAHLF